MQTIYIKKASNAYTCEISSDYSIDQEEFLFFYKTEEEMVADFPNVVAKAREMFVEAQAKKAAKKAE